MCREALSSSAPAAGTILMSRVIRCLALLCILLALLGRCLQGFSRWVAKEHEHLSIIHMPVVLHRHASACSGWAAQILPWETSCPNCSCQQCDKQCWQLVSGPDASTAASVQFSQSNGMPLCMHTFPPAALQDTLTSDDACSCAGNLTGLNARLQETPCNSKPKWAHGHVFAKPGVDVQRLPNGVCDCIAQ